MTIDYDEQIINLKKDIEIFLNEDTKELALINESAFNICNKEFYAGRISAFEQILELMENI